MSTVLSIAARSPGRPRRPDQEEERRRQLIQAAVDEIAERGFQRVTVAGIAGRAGVSVGLVSFYFRDKDGLLEATLRSLAADLGRAVASRAVPADDPRGRIQAIIDANLSDTQFDRRIITVWLAFWGEVPHQPRYARVQRVYERRMQSNLAHAIRRLAPRADAGQLARSLASLIDGLWIRAALSPDRPDSAEARQIATRFIETELLLARLEDARLSP